MTELRWRLLHCAMFSAGYTGGAFIHGFNEADIKRCFVVSTVIFYGAFAVPFFARLATGVQR